MAAAGVTIMGVFVADLAFRVDRLPQWGETVLGSSFRMGPGGKGSNQAIAAARLGARVSFISKLGRDTFGELARRVHGEEGVSTDFLFDSPTRETGGAAIVVDEKGENAIVVVGGAADELTGDEVDRAEERIAASAVFMSQLELKVPIVERGLALARRHDVTTILNPAPAVPLSPQMVSLADYLTPNESEAATLAGFQVRSVEDAERAAAKLMDLGAANVIVTLGARGALVVTPERTEHVPAVDAGAVVDTTGAGDAFNGGFATALAEGRDPVEATRFACAVAAVSVTRPGTAPSMPTRKETDALLGLG